MQTWSDYPVLGLHMPLNPGDLWADKFVRCLLHLSREIAQSRLVLVKCKHRNQWTDDPKKGWTALEGGVHGSECCKHHKHTRVLAQCIQGSCGCIVPGNRRCELRNHNGCTCTRALPPASLLNVLLCSSCVLTLWLAAQASLLCRALQYLILVVTCPTLPKCTRHLKCLTC